MFSDPEKNVAELGLQPGNHVADIGSGSGYYAFALAKAVGPEGRVYAVEVQQDLLQKLSNEAKSRGVAHIETIWGDVERQGGTKLGDGAVAAAVVGNILFQIEDKPGFVREMARIVKPGGKILVVDWSESFGGMGPHKDHVVTKDAAVELFGSGGFARVKEIDAGSHHYGVILQKN